MNSNERAIFVRVVPASDRVEALWQLFNWEPESQRRERIAICLEFGRSESSAFQFLLEAVRSGTRLGCVWGHVAAGRIANVWPPSCLPEAASIVAETLQTTLDEHLAAAAIVCGQALLPPAAEKLAEPLLNNGYCHAAKLLFLACNRDHFAKQPPASELHWEPYSPEKKSRLVKLIDETYDGSLDAPILNGLRTTEDVVEGYVQTGIHRAERWLFVRYQDRDVGCLLLTEHRQGQQWELLYMGLVPHVRGRGWGEIVTRHALWLANEAGASAMLLGVDAENHPAIANYANCGFYELDRRWALIKRFGLTN